MSHDGHVLFLQQGVCHRGTPLPHDLHGVHHADHHGRPENTRKREDSYLDQRSHHLFPNRGNDPFLSLSPLVGLGLGHYDPYRGLGLGLGLGPGPGLGLGLGHDLGPDLHALVTIATTETARTREGTIAATTSIVLRATV